MEKEGREGEGRGGEEEGEVRGKGRGGEGTGKGRGGGGGGRGGEGKEGRSLDFLLSYIATLYEVTLNYCVMLGPIQSP